MRNKIKILYIEDNLSNRNLVRYTLNLDIFDYYDVADALTGITKAKEIIPDIILMDINMDGMSGIEATIRIKQIPSLSNVKIIAVTARTLIDDREKIIASGCSYYIAKPINVATFEKTILDVYAGNEETLSEQQHLKYLRKNQDEIVAHLEQEVLRLTNSKKILKDSMMKLECKNEELKNTQKMLIHSEKLATQGQLIASIIHEIKNPLTGIMGYNQLLKTHINDEQLQGYVVDSIKEVEKIKKIIADMLNFSRKPDNAVKEVLVSEIFNNVKSLIKILSQQAGIKISIEMLFSDMKIKGDINALEQVILILVNNAIDAVKQKGITEFNTPPVQIMATMDTQNNDVIISVKDQGIGITDDIKNKIFDAFYTTKDFNHGTGLGLNICQTIVKSFNGRIEFESIPGSMTTFKVFFPNQNIR